MAGLLGHFKKGDDTLPYLKGKPRRCIIENSLFGYFLHVDSEVIYFTQTSAAEYFKRHYKTLGYEIKETSTWQDAVRRP